MVIVEEIILIKFRFSFENSDKSEGSSRQIQSNKDLSKIVMYVRKAISTVHIFSKEINAKIII
jgi:hypothetical protein